MRWSNRFVQACAWIGTVAAVFGGFLLARGLPGDAVPGWLCVASALLMQSELVAVLRTLLRFHADEYRRLTGKEP